MDNKIKILIILTGGTIGSSIENKTIDVRKNSAMGLLEAYNNEDYHDVNEIDFEIMQPYQLLSENTTLEIWTKLSKTLCDIDYSKYDGVIVTHGTDTYSYAATLVGTMFDKKLDIPLLLVSSNYAIGEPKSNGLANFRNSVCFIKEAKRCLLLNEMRGYEYYKGVFCIYQDSKMNNNVYRAVEIMEADTCIDQFGVFGGENYGCMVNEKFYYNVNHTNHCEPFVKLPEKTAIEFKKDALMIKNYPGLNYNYISLKNLQTGEETDRPGAVLHNLYHSATACIADGNHSFLEFVERCEEENIPCYVNGFKKDVSAKYATTSIIEQSPIIKMYDLSPEAAYANVVIDINTP